MSGHYVMALAEGAMYSSYKEFQAALATFCLQTNSKFTVHDCKSIEKFNTKRVNGDRFPTHLKYKYAKVACERYGQPRHEGKGLRNKGSKKNGCGAHVCLTARKTKRETYLHVVRLVTKHSNQCEIRRKQKKFKMMSRGRGGYKNVQVPDTDDDSSEVPEPPPSDQNAAPNTTQPPAPALFVKQEPEDDEDFDEYTYPVKPVVVYSDDETEEQKPVPIFHLNHDYKQPAESPSAPPPSTKDSALNENVDSCESRESLESNGAKAQDEQEDVKPLPLADRDRPSLRALLLPAMALNFSQRVIPTET